MGWERRQRGGRYYTRSRRVNGRVVREYVGADEVAEAFAQRDALDREERRQKEDAFRAVWERLDAADQAVGEFSALVDTLAQGALVAAGYRQHNRGEWRRRRHDRQEAGTRA